MLEFDTIRQGLTFKYYVNGGTPFLRATYKKQGYEHSVIIVLSDETAKIIDERIIESMLAMQAYATENPEDDKPAEVVKSNPRAIKHTIESESGTAIVTAKTPREIDKEAEDEADRLAQK